VTERVLATARDVAAAQQRAAAAAVTPGMADPLALGVQLASLLGEDAASLLDAWRAVVARGAGLSPSESLALAEREIAAGREAEQ
jgi:hypothetical protein